MGLEVVTFISDLVAANPVGATDPKSAGDNHIRNIKAAILATFAAITGAVTASHTELNYMTGATGVTGTGNTVRSASPTFTGTLTAATVAATTLTGAGSGLTALNASNLASGTVPDARFPATLPAASAANLTAIPAANVTGSHTLPDGVLSTNVPLLNAANTFTATDQKVSASNPRLTLNDTSAANVAAFRFESNGTLKGFVGLSNKTGGLVTGDATGEMAIRVETNKLNVSLDGGTTKHLTLASTGAVTTPNARADELGYKGMPAVGGSADYPLALTDAGKFVWINASGVKTITIPAEASINFPIGTVISIGISDTSGCTLAITSDALYLAGTAFATGGAGVSRTLAHGALVTIVKAQSALWLVSGAGIS